MATIRLKGGKWRVEVRRKGVRESGSFDTKIEAQAWAVEREQRIGKGAVVTGKTLGMAFDKYAAEVSVHKKGERWELVRLNKIKRSWIANEQLADLMAEDLSKWAKEQKISGSSVRRELGLIAAVLKTARTEWKWMQHDIMRDVWKPKEARARDRRISDGEIKLVLDTLGFAEKGFVVSQRQKIAVAFLLAIETAMRQGEMWALDWKDVSIEKQVAVVLDSKNGDRRRVPLSKRAVELLKKLEPKESGMVIGTPQESSGVIFRRIVKMAGIDNLTFHDTRHEAITRLAKKLPMLDLARMVGHRDPRSLMVYYNETAEEIAKRLD
jgi:integrase